MMVTQQQKLLQKTSFFLSSYTVVLITSSQGDLMYIFPGQGWGGQQEPGHPGGHSPHKQGPGHPGGCFPPYTRLYDSQLSFRPGADGKQMGVWSRTVLWTSPARGSGFCPGETMWSLCLGMMMPPGHLLQEQPLRTGSDFPDT